MICRLTGRVEGAQDGAVVLSLGGIAYEALAPAQSIAELMGAVGAEVTLHTLQYMEGAPTGTHFTPRLVGFLTPADRDFFELFTRVKGISTRRALRAMCLPTWQLAGAIEAGDERLLTSLPEIGKRTAAQIIADLRGKLTAFLAPQATSAPFRELSHGQQLAVDILVQWGDRRVDAQRWVTAAVEADVKLSEPDEIVKAAYAQKARFQTR
jgi:Holliday junction DNA helicase RuvA